MFLSEEPLKIFNNIFSSLIIIGNYTIIYDFFRIKI
jgi:hypothetical protein